MLLAEQNDDEEQVYLSVISVSFGDSAKFKMRNHPLSKNDGGSRSMRIYLQTKDQGSDDELLKAE